METGPAARALAAPTDQTAESDSGVGGTNPSHQHSEGAMPRQTVRKPQLLDRKLGLRDLTARRLLLHHPPLPRHQLSGIQRRLMLQAQCPRLRHPLSRETRHKPLRRKQAGRAWQGPLNQGAIPHRPLPWGPISSQPCRPQSLPRPPRRRAFLKPQADMARWMQSQV